MIRALLRTVWPDEDGYTIVELLVVMAILGVVMTGLTAVFVGGSNTEVRLNNRFRAQQDARAALDRIRSDIHCASKAQAPVAAISAYPALALDVTKCTPTTTTPTYDYWCAVSSSTSPQRYQLWRTSSTAAPTATTCTSTDTARVLVASNLVSSSVFTTAATPQNGLQTVGVDFKVSGNQLSNTKDVYELADLIVVRNSARCITSSCTVPSVP